MKSACFIIPQNVKKAMDIMNNAGFESFLVGGCVRDFLMGKIPHDYDITTNALPEQTINCFSDFRVIETGIKHGTVTVLIEDEPIEITTYRIDGEYDDNRHPKEVTFTRNIGEDLSRRDFTVNALAYDGKGKVIDLFSGCEDIDKKIIRCVGDADKRFEEDGLRILRALRFSSVLEFSVSVDTSVSIHKNRELLKNISAERIYTELTKLVCGSNAKNVLLQFYDVLQIIFPEITPEHKNCISAMEKCERYIPSRLAALVSFSESPQKIIKRLKPDNNTLNEVSALVSDLKVRIFDDKIRVKQLLINRNFEYFRHMILFKKAFGEDEQLCERVMKLADEVQQNNECVSLKQLKINGRDIMSLGNVKGKAVGEVLNKLLNSVICGKVDNEPEALKRQAVKILSK